MTQETLVAVFDTKGQASLSVIDLVHGGILPADIERHARAALEASTTSTAASAQDGGFWTYLFGGETSREQNAVYEHTVRSGGEVMTVLLRDVESDAERVMRILATHSPVDVVDRAAALGVFPSVPTADAVEQVLQLSEERLTVGKREVDRGTTRLRRFVRTAAVEGTVTLRDETVSLERRMMAADREAGPDAFVAGVIEMTETREEAVLSKRTRVREEVVLRKAVTERVETIRENLRTEQIEVEQVPAPNASIAVSTSSL